MGRKGCGHRDVLHWQRSLPTGFPALILSGPNLPSWWRLPLVGKVGSVEDLIEFSRFDHACAPSLRRYFDGETLLMTPMDKDGPSLASLGSDQFDKLTIAYIYSDGMIAPTGTSPRSAPLPSCPGYIDVPLVLKGSAEKRWPRASTSAASAPSAGTRRPTCATGPPPARPARTALPPSSRTPRVSRPRRRGLG